MAPSNSGFSLGPFFTRPTHRFGHGLPPSGPHSALGTAAAHHPCGAQPAVHQGRLRLAAKPAPCHPRAGRARGWGAGVRIRSRGGTDGKRRTRRTQQVEREHYPAQVPGSLSGHALRSGPHGGGHEQAPGTPSLYPACRYTTGMPPPCAMQSTLFL